MAENTHTIRMVLNKRKWEFERCLEEWTKNKDFSLGFRTQVVEFERTEAVQT